MSVPSLGHDTRIRVCFPFVGDGLGGSHVSAAKLIRSFDRDRVVPVVVLQRVDGPLAPFLERENIRYVHLPVPETLSPHVRSPVAAATYLVRSLPLIRRFLQEGRFDVVHTNDGRVHVNWGLAARLAGAKLVWHHRADPGAKGARLLAPLIAHRMVTVSRFSRPSRPLLALEGRLDVIRSPFDHPVSRPERGAAKAALLAELGLEPETRVLGYFGSLIDRKRPLLFVDVLHRFRQRHPDVPVVGCLYGVSAPGGTDFEALVRARAAELGVGDAIRLMGYRSPVERFMAATDILLVPAVGEPFGRTLIEAMFLGTPVVATNHGGNPEAITDDHNGYLVEPENADAFVPAIARLLADPETFERIATCARDGALRAYGSATHVEQIMSVYERALTPRRAVRPAGALTESMP